MSVTNSNIALTMAFNPAQFIREVIRLYDQSLLFIIVASHTMASLLFFFVWSIYPNPTVLGWYLFFSIFSLARLFNYHYFRSNNDYSINIATISYLLALISALISGVSWGSVGVLLNSSGVYDYSQLKLINCFLVILMSGMLAVCARVNIKQPLVLLLFSLPAVAIYSCYLLLQDGMFLFLLGLLLPSYFFFLMVIYYRFDKALFRKLFPALSTVKSR